MKGDRKQETQEYESQRVFAIIPIFIASEFGERSTMLLEDTRPPSEARIGHQNYRFINNAVETPEPRRTKCGAKAGKEDRVSCWQPVN